MAPKLQRHTEDFREKEKNIVDYIDGVSSDIFISLRKTPEETKLPSEFVTGASS